jgi:phosphate transport system substrate-binding protein
MRIGTWAPMARGTREKLRPATGRPAWFILFLAAGLSITGAIAGAITAGITTVVAQERIMLVGSGSSVPGPLYNKWAQEYNKRDPRVQLQYLPIGTSEGIKQISKGSSDFSAGEVQLTAAERAEGNLTELPAVLIGVVPVYNLPTVHQELRFSGEVLAEIYLGEVKNWNDAAIARLNPNVSLPNLPINVFYRPAGKGTNYVFTDFLSKTSPKFRSRIGVTPSPKWPVGEAAERSADMADKVKAQTGAIGYVEQQYAVKNNIAFGSVQNASGRFVKASTETITAACRAIEAPQWDKFAPSLTNPPGEDSFPITSFSWVYARTTPSDAKRAAAVAELLNWIFTDGQQIAAQEGYSPLPQALAAKVKDKVKALR